MRQKFTIITLGVRNFKKALSFYENLGWQKSDKSMEEYALLYPLQELSEDTTLPYQSSGFAGITISYNAKSEAEVDAVLSKVSELGATIVKPAQKVFWGGYSGYFKDLDGYLFEVAYNPFWEFDENDNLKL